MDTLDCIYNRRSIRKFLNIPVEWFKIGRILEAGLNAPSAGNLIDFRFMVINDDAKKKEIAKHCMNQNWMANAHVYIVVTSTYVKTQRFYGVRGEKLYSIQSAAAATQNMLLAAHSLDLGACWVGAFDEDLVKELLKIPDYARVQSIIPIGYTDEKPPRPPKYSLTDMVHFNFYGDNAAKMSDIRTEVLKEWSPYTERAVNKIKDTIDNSSTIGEKITKHAKNLHENIKKKFNK
ncbi:MAG: nitroreductase family protein [Candidatus Woesearchaeota archaeon]